MSAASQTTDHSEIQHWVNERDGFPATVSDTSQGSEAGLLRIGFDQSDSALKKISWKEFFDKFEEEELALLYQEETEDGQVSRFCKLISRDVSR